MKYCSACGMPLLKKEDFAGGNENSEFCLYCVDEKGNVKSCEEIFEGGVNFFLSQLGDDRVLAEKVVRRNMNSLSYWQNKGCAILEGDMVTDEEFQAIMQKL